MYTCGPEAGPMGQCLYPWLNEGPILDARVCIFCEYSKFFSLPVHSNDSINSGFVYVIGEIMPRIKVYIYMLIKELV